MLPDWEKKLSDYVATFQAEDEELYAQDIPNAAAFDYLKHNMPLLDCPDKELERVYYYRFWTLRKHWKNTPFGHILTEFLPPVGWAGPYNSINCALGHHLREARWLRDTEGFLWEYVRFWLDGHGDAFAYSMWFASALEDLFALKPDDALLREFVPKLDAWYCRREENSLRPCGLFWSNDGCDGMEYSISGPGLRPTLNTYMCADAFAISRMAEKAGLPALAAAYKKRGDALKERINALLWDGDFYRTIPCGEKDRADFTVRPEVQPDRRVRELAGFLPWYFHLAPPDREETFLQLLDPDGFAAPFGMTTAERRHPRFLFRHPHECLWNGYVWPFATSQTLTATASMIRDCKEKPPLSNDDFYRLLRKYADMHRLTDGTGKTHNWIDEVMEPFTGRWYARDRLQSGLMKVIGGPRERGKDYNHSTFCDLVLSGLLGIRYEDGALTADPILPADWTYFSVTGLTRENMTLVYDKDGTHYGLGAGLRLLSPGEGAAK